MYTVAPFQRGIEGEVLPGLLNWCSRSVSHRYLQNAIAQIYNTTNDTGYHA
ncbi:hypothetical protein [Nostoc sp.]|uniref:hypothetical protein n=1 Tax=Nostoc sp. TaxID=1180 RepID=UPI002FFA37C0